MSKDYNEMTNLFCLVQYVFCSVVSRDLFLKFLRIDLIILGSLDYSDTCFGKIQFQKIIIQPIIYSQESKQYCYKNRNKLKK